MPFIVCEFYCNKKWHRLKSRQKEHTVRFHVNKCKNWVEFTYSDGNGDPRGEAFWQQTCSVLTGAVGTQVYTRSSSRCVHFMQIIAHIKRNVLKGCSLALALPSEMRPCARRLCWKWVLRAAAICLFPAGADLGQEVIVWPPGNELSWG